MTWREGKTTSPNGVKIRYVQREAAALLTRDLRTGYAAPVLRSTMRWLTENWSRKTW